MSYPDWRERFLEAVDTGFYPAEWLDWLVGTGRARLWENDEAAILAEIRQYPSGAKEVHGVVAAGDLKAIVALIPLAEQWGREQGCVRAAIASRPEWVRVLKDYEPSQLEIVKEL
jgi:hypothetical protein